MDLKKEFAKEAIEIIRASKDGIIKGFGYVSETFPELLREIIIFSFARGIMWAIVGCLIIYGSWRLFKRVESAVEDYPGNEGMQYLLGIPAFLGLCIFFFSLEYLAKAIFAPKLFLMEYFLKFQL